MGDKICGELTDSGAFHHVTWRIPNFFALIEKPGSFLQSAKFPFIGELYYLQMYTDRSNYVDICLVKLASSVPKNILYEVQCGQSSGRYLTFNRFLSSRGMMFCVKRSELQEERDRFLPAGVLTLYCCLRMNSEWSMLHEKGLAGVKNLQSDYKRLLMKGVESDAILVVCGKEFKAHRSVLRARSPVFEAMFVHEMAENKSGLVFINDLRQDCFQDFLEYLYTGHVKVFSDNVFGLYAAANKYDVSTLMSECLEYIGKSLSTDNFCDVITLALQDDVKDLLELAVEFFKNNMASIILTVKWQQFMRDNPTRVNELLIKVHMPGND